jgi:hypothetical protein
MNNPIFSFIILPLFLFITYWLALKIRGKLAKPKYEDEVQTPGGFDTFLLKVLTVLTVFSGIFTILGIAMQETEMAIVFLVLTVIFAGIVLLLRRQYDMSYQENNDYFILNAQKKEYQVYYDDIVDWQPHLNEVRVLDESREDEEYIRVNISIFKPEILLRKIAEMTFEGKFYTLDDFYFDDPTREYEVINYLTQNNYSYLIEDYIDEQN